MPPRGRGSRTGRRSIPIARVRGALSPIKSVAPRSLFGRRGAEPLVAFVHIPKTAGGTVTSMLTGAYSTAEVRDAGNYLRHPDKTPRTLARSRWTGARVVVGHIPYGLFRKSLPRDTRYVTFLREPVDRVLSHYHRHLQRKSAADSLEEALEMGLPDVNDLATRFLCGDRSPLGELRASALEDAKANLREFALVGLQERFEESVVLLQRTLGLDLVTYLNDHVSVDRPRVGEISAEQRARIAEFNRLDAELYSFARELFEDAVAACDDGFGTDVEALRALSADANQQAIQNARDWLDRELPVGATRPNVALYAAAEAAGVPRPALKHVIDVSSVKKVKGRGGEKLLTRSEESHGDHV